MTSLNNLGKKIKLHRNRKGLSQEDLHKATKIPLTTITKIEGSFIKKPSMEKVAKIAEALDISIEDLASSNKLNRIVNEYLLLRPLYEKYSKDVKSIVSKIIHNNGIFAQTVTCRTKLPKSLLKKINDQPKVKRDIDTAGLKAVEDLSGIRVIVYLESDILKVENMIYEEFGRENIVRRSKFSEDGYNALHLIIQFSKERLELTEYSEYEGFKCEIQITTVLYHSWNELSHETLYKLDREDKEGFEDQYKIVEDELNQIVKEHIEPAQIKFQTTFENFQSVKKGKTIFSQLFLEEVGMVTNLNDLHARLSILEANLTMFGNKFPENFPLIEELTKIYKQAQSQKEKDITTPLGQVSGKTLKDVTNKYVEILRLMLYQYPEEVLNSLFELLPKATEQITIILTEFAKYDIQFLKKYRYFSQLIFLDHIESMSKKDLKDNIQLIVDIMATVLSAECEGKKRTDYRTMQITRGGLRVNEELESIRDRAIIILKQLFDLQDRDSTKKSVIRALYNVMLTPTIGSTNELETLIVKNSNTILDFYIEKIDKFTFEELYEIEENLFFVANTCFEESKFPNLERFKESIKSNDEYQLFKLFFGYDHKFRKTFDPAKDDVERKREIKKVIKTIIKPTYDEWISRLKKYSPNINKSSDQGMYNHLFGFLNTISETHPRLGWRILDEVKTTNINWVLNIIIGLWKSKDPNLRTKIKEWLENETHLDTLSFLFQNLGREFDKNQNHKVQIDLKLYREIFDKLKDSKDKQGLIVNLIGGLLRYPVTDETRKLFIEGIEQLTRSENTNWVGFWFGIENMLKDLNPEQSQIIYKNLLLRENLDYHCEEVLAFVAQNDLTKLVAFFEKRVAMKITKSKRDPFSRYYPIPFRIEVPNLQKLFDTNPDEVIGQVLKWFDKENQLFKREGGHLIFKLYGLSEPVKNTLTNEIRQKSIKSAKKVLHILEAYNGANIMKPDMIDDVLEIAVRFIGIHHSRVRLIIILKGIITHTGMVWGEFGLADAYEVKRASIKHLLNHKNLNVARVFQELDRELETMAKSERRRSKLDIDRMKKGLR